MRRGLAGAALAALVLPAVAGCYTTRVDTLNAGRGPTYSDRQWFTIGGLVPLSGAAGRECPDGAASVRSEMAVTDWLIAAGLSIAGGLVGGAVCEGTDDSARAACVSGFSTFVPFLLASRTVRYRCTGGRTGLLPPPGDPAWAALDPAGLARRSAEGEAAPAPVGP